MYESVYESVCVCVCVCVYLRGRHSSFSSSPNSTAMAACPAAFLA